MTIFRAHFFVTTCTKRLSFFYLSLLFPSFNFHRTLFSRAPEFAWAPRKQIYVRFTWNLNTLFKHTFVCLITHSFFSVFTSNLDQCFSYVYSISITMFSLFWSFECMWELLLHFRLIFFIIWTPFKSFALNLRWKYYITVLLIPESLKQLWQFIYKIFCLKNKCVVCTCKNNDRRT